MQRLDNAVSGVEASYYFPVVAGVNAGDLEVLVLVVDDGKPLHHAWVNPAGLVRYRRRWVVGKLVHQRCGQHSAVLGDSDGLGLF